MTVLHAFLWVLGTYTVFGFITALVLSTTPFSANGFFVNWLFAWVYWCAALRWNR